MKTQQEIIVDSFAGGGGASLGLTWAGLEPDEAINHDEAAIAMHVANHPNCRHHTKDIRRLRTGEVTLGRPVGLAWFSPDCFPAGTLVLTTEGYTPIEQIKVGDFVLTHLSRWRRVTATMASVKPTRVIRGHGHHGLCVSGEHPFFVTHRTNAWDNGTRHYRPQWSSPNWVNAKDLVALSGRDAKQAGHYWCTPQRFDSLPVPEIGGRGISLDARLWWLVGRYLADGWTRLTDTRAELVICCGKHKEQTTEERLGQWPREGQRSEAGELAWHKREIRTEFQYSTNNRGLVEWLRCHFGHLAHEKRIPGWVYGMDQEDRRALLDGYLAGDGWDSGEFIEAVTVSRALAFGVKSLAVSLGFAPCVYPSRGNTLIEGRTVNARPAYRIRWRYQPDPSHAQSVSMDGRLFTPIREIEEGGEQEVFNISVEEDESYIAESIIVHNCCHFSRAKGAKPVKKEIRGLAWEVIRWAVEQKPRVIILENVREFEDWGPLVQKHVDGVPQWLEDGSPVLVPDPNRKGHSFKRWAGRLRGLGYEVQWRVMNAADYGAPTHRRRLFLIARCDGQPIVWPEPTHGDPKKLNDQPLFGALQPWRTAAECIDWSIPCKSIFGRFRDLLKKQCRNKKSGKRCKGKYLRHDEAMVSCNCCGHVSPQVVESPLAENTLRRIAMGIKRYVLQNPKPYIVQVNHAGPEFRGQDLGEPLSTVTGKHGYGVVVPHVTKFRGDSVGSGADQPLPTITSGAGAARPAGAAHAMGVVSACVTRLGQTGGNGSYAQDVVDPLTTITSKAEHLVVAPVLVGAGGPVYAGKPIPADAPLPTVMTENHRAVVAATLVQTGYGERQGQAPRCLDLEKPLGTVVNGQKHAIVNAFLTKHYSGDDQSRSHSLDRPIGTVTSWDHHSLVAATLAQFAHGGDGRWSDGVHHPEKPLNTIHAGGKSHGIVAANLVHLNHGDKQWNGVDEPLRTVTSGNHAALVYSFLTKYFGTAIGANLIEPMPTATGKDRFGLVTVNVDGEPYVIVDISMRMLTPRELARAQGFPDSYILTGSKSSQVARIGNSVVPMMAKVLAEANYKPAKVQRKAKVS